MLLIRAMLAVSPITLLVPSWALFSEGSDKTVAGLALVLCLVGFGVTLLLSELELTK